MTDVKAHVIGSTVSAGPRFLYSVCIAVLMAFGLYATFVVGRTMRADAKTQLDREIAGESAAFCEKFGMRADTSNFAACSQQLAIVRQKQAERDSAAALGLL